MNVKDRIIRYIEYKKLPVKRFEEKSGLSNGYVSSMRKGLGTEKLDNVLTAFPDLNRDWLLYGEGEMLKKTNSDDVTNAESALTGKIIPLYDAEVAAGTAYGMEMDPARPIGMIEIGSFLKDSESALRVYGNSMTPHYPPGCIVGTKLWIEQFIEPGKVYVIETEDNRFLKRLYYNKDKNALRCLSDNTMKHETGPATGEYCYPEFEIPLSSIRRLHRVVGVIRRNII